MNSPVVKTTIKERAEQYLRENTSFDMDSPGAVQRLADALHCSPGGVYPHLDYLKRLSRVVDPPASQNGDHHPAEAANLPAVPRPNPPPAATPAPEAIRVPSAPARLNLRPIGWIGRDTDGNEYDIRPRN